MLVRAIPSDATTRQAAITILYVYKRSQQRPWTCSYYHNNDFHSIHHQARTYNMSHLQYFSWPGQGVALGEAWYYSQAVRVQDRIEVSGQGALP
jgi:hypothetical protein